MNLAENGFVVEPRLENIFIFGLKRGAVESSEGNSCYHSQTKVRVSKQIVLCFSEVEVYANQHDFITDMLIFLCFLHALLMSFTRASTCAEILFL